METTTHKEIVMELTEPDRKRFGERLRELGVIHTSCPVKTPQTDKQRSALADLIIRCTPEGGGK